MRSTQEISKDLDPHKAKESKKIYDSLYGFIGLGAFEFKAVQHPFFERLRFIHQLGAALWVYPGARSSRYEHSLGVCAIATRIYDHITQEAEKKGLDLGLNSQEILYWRSVLRLAALYHDIGHLPFSHVGELAFTKEHVQGSKMHEDLGKRLLRSTYFDPLFSLYESEHNLDNGSFRADVIDVAFGGALEPLIEGERRTTWKKIICQIITSDFFGADRIDYLLRDTHATGLSCQFDHEQLIDKLALFEDTSGMLNLGVMLSGLESVEGLIVSRYFVHRRLYYHEGVRVYSMHLANIMREEFLTPFESLDAFLGFSDVEVLNFIRGFKGKNPHVEALKAPYEKRFVALEIELCNLAQNSQGHTSLNPQGILDLELKVLQEKCAIPDAHIDWKYGSRLMKTVLVETARDLQVLMPSGDIRMSSELSSFLSERLKGLSGIKYWIFVHSDYLEPVMSYKPKAFRFIHVEV